MWGFLILFSAGGAAITAYDKDEMEAHTTVFIGAYLIIRGLSFFIGGYPNEVKIFTEISEGKFNLSVPFLLYVLLFVLLNVVGIYVQHRTDPGL
jgi:hypothetical protein